MEGKIKITSKTSDTDLFAKYKGIYLSEKSIQVTGYSEVVDKIPTKILSRGNEVFIDSEPVGYLIEGNEYNVTFIPFLYANNPQKEIILTITKILK